MTNTYKTIELAPGVALKMLHIPGGTFMMGSPEEEVDRYDDEGPQHEVRVATFFMAKYPITQAQWRQVAQLERVNRDLDLDPARFKGDNRPVEQVSWHDATEFCARLSRLSGREYRLPSEAEWEYACRAGTTTPFHFGKTLTTDLANYDGNYTYADGPKGDYRQETTPVDHFSYANAWGLSNMHGNVWEWCLDHYHDSYEGVPTDGSAWVDAEAEKNKPRIIRGGSWNFYPRYCRSAYRFLTFPVNRHYDLGFRVVSVPPSTLR